MPDDIMYIFQSLMVFLINEYKNICKFFKQRCIAAYFITNPSLRLRAQTVAKTPTRLSHPQNFGKVYSRGTC